MAETTKHGLKYSVKGFSALGNTNSRELGYSSRYNTLKTHEKGIKSLVAAAGSNSLTINHGLRYRPAFNAYFRDTLTGEVYQVMSGFEDVTFSRSGAEINVHAKSTNSTLAFTIYNNTASNKNVDIFYEIFIEDIVKI